MKISLIHRVWGLWMLALGAFALAGVPRTAAAAAPGVEGSTGASAVVTDIQSALIDAMKAGAEKSFDDRVAALKPVVERTHEMDVVAKVVLGRKWRELTDGQKTAFKEKFARLGLLSYAANFNSYGGQSFRILEEKPGQENQMLVRSEMIDPDGTKHQFDYVLTRKENAGWRIINVIVDGVSDLALKRSEYAEVIQRDGFDGLMKKLDEKIEEQIQLDVKNKK